MSPKFPLFITKGKNAKDEMSVKNTLQVIFLSSGP
jgi:hypothetical protein